MAKENETIAEIIAEMRNDANADEYTPDGILGQKLNYIADRIETAHRREVATTKESLAVGNSGDCAKLREALKQASELNDLWFDTFSFPDGATSIHDEIEDIISAALAAPPRNCDRFANAVEAMAELKRVHSYCAKENRRCLEDCPDCGKEWCSLAWLFAPATESEAQA